VGYDLITEDDLTLTLRGGLGGSREWGSDNEDIRPEALLGADLAWQISDAQDLTADTTIFPDLEEFGEFRTVSNLGFSWKLAETSNVALSAGLQHEYQSQVDPGTKHNDLRLYAGLQFDF